LINVLTKDIDVFVNCSWQFPYLVTVPLNTIISAVFLYRMFGAAVFICYLGMIGLLLLQYFSNKSLKMLQMKFL